MVEEHKISIVINTYNRGFSLPKTLASFEKLNYRNFEVVIVNGPSTDNTTEVVESIAGRVKYLECEEINISKSRNIGIAASAGEIIAFIDDDAIPESNWLQELNAKYADPRVGGVGGPVFDENGFGFQAQYIISDRFGESRFFPICPEIDLLNFPYARMFPAMMGVNSSFRREVLFQIGGFDEYFAYYLDETDVCLRVIDAGYRIDYAPLAFVHHKFLPSHLRDHRKVIKNIYPCVRSQVYYILVNASFLYSPEEVEGGISEAINKFTEHIHKLHEEGLLTLEERDESLISIAKGADDARLRILSQGKRELLNQPESLMSPFKRFKPRHSLPKRGKSKLNLIYLSQEYPPDHNGGIGRWNYEMAVGMSGRGHEVHVLTKHADFSTPRVDFENGVWVHRLRPELIEQDRSTFPSIYQTLPAHVVAFSETCHEAIRKLRNRVGKDFIVSAPIWDLEGLRCSLDSEIPLVTTLQTTAKLSVPFHPEWIANENFYKQNVLPIIKGEEYLLRNSKALHTISKSILASAKVAYESDFKRAIIANVPIGIRDFAALYTEESLPFKREAGEIYILFVGRLESRKGIDTLLEVIPELCLKYSNVNFRIVGRTDIPSVQGLPYKDEFICRHQGESFLNRVHFLGRLSDEKTFAEYRHCDFFVAPSKFESFGLIYVESMCFGKGVIGCRDAGGAEEIITNMHDGILVQPGNPQSLRESLELLINNEELRRTLGINARKTYESRFSSTLMEDHLEEFYTTLLERRQTSEEEVISEDFSARFLSLLG